MANNAPEKYDVRTIHASKLAEKNEAEISDITIQIKEMKGLKKVLVTLSQAAEDGWNDVRRFWAANLPTPEDIAALAHKRIVDLFLQRGWDDENKQWGKIKVVKFFTADGEEIVLNGPKDEPGLTLDGSED